MNSWSGHGGLSAVGRRIRKSYRVTELFGKLRIILIEKDFLLHDLAQEFTL